MTGPTRFRRTEEPAAEAHRLLAQGDGQTTAGVRAALLRPVLCPPVPPPIAVGMPSLDSRLGPTLPRPGSKSTFACSPRRSCTRSASVEAAERGEVDKPGGFPGRSRLRRALAPTSGVLVSHIHGLACRSRGSGRGGRQLSLVPVLLGRYDISLSRLLTSYAQWCRLELGRECGGL